METLTFFQNNLIQSSFCAFEDMRVKKELLDFHLAFEKRSFEGHRVVLAAAVPYFREIFATGKGEITLDEIYLDALDDVINFAYSGKIEISYENVRSLISATKFFHLDEMYDACCKFLGEKIHVNNVWKIRTFAESHNCSELLSVADQYIRQNFETFSESESFEDVPFSYLKEIICQDDLKVVTEEKVFEAVIRWVKFSPNKRKDHLLDLLLSVRMSQLAFDYLTERALQNELILTVKSCKELVEEAKFCYLLPEKLSECSFITRPRRLEVQKLQRNDEVGLYVVCDSESGISVKFLNADNQKWMNVSHNEVKHLHKVAVFGARIYIFLENTINIFHVKTRTWRSLGTFHESLLMSAVVCHNKNIYFFGGPHMGSDLIRCFSPRKNDWVEEDKMKKCVDFPAAASLGNFIYVTGGYLKDTIFKTVGRYDPETKKWEVSAPMLSQRYGHGCTSINGKIYVCGGTNDSEYLSSVEVYDPKTDLWKIVSSMKAPRTFFSIVPHDGKIYAFGGMTKGYTTAAEMEVYDPDSNKWKSGVTLSDDTKCEIHLVKAKVPAETDKRGSVESLASTTSHLSKGKKQKFVPLCYYCRKRGHSSRMCWYKLCYNCGKPGHPAADCTLNNKTDVKCSQCGKTGQCIHDRDRPPPKRNDAKCYSCGGIGHLSRDCPSFGGPNKKGF